MFLMLLSVIGCLPWGLSSAPSATNTWTQQPCNNKLILRGRLATWSKTSCAPSAPQDTRYSLTPEPGGTCALKAEVWCK